MTNPIQAGQAVPGQVSANAGVLADLIEQETATAESEAALTSVLAAASAADPALAAAQAADPAVVTAEGTVDAAIAAVDP